MLTRSVVVLDVGKTNAKLSLWDRNGKALERRIRSNAIQHANGDRTLDVTGIEEWLADTLSGFARLADIGFIVPVGHGAAAALVSDGMLFAPPLDYEQEFTAAERDEYGLQRDAFAATGSPRLPQGLNLGMQLHHLEQLGGPWPEGLSILPWPQYWAWRLCGVMASEVTSLGCHSDLWRPAQAEFSQLARRRGWARRMAPLRRADTKLATVTPYWVTRTGIPRDCVVLCGLHDSNAALLAARGHAQIRDNDATVLSTGTWFVAMRSPAYNAPVDMTAMREARDCLVNVDANGQPTPSARFMGGREAQLIAHVDPYAVTTHYDPQRILARLPELLRTGAAALPTFAAGFGPFPAARGEWRNKPTDVEDQLAVVGLYLALMADACLDLLGSRDHLLIEGRFSEATVFTRALAALRPQQKVYVSNAHDDVPYGALRLLYPQLPPSSPLEAVAPLDVDFRRYAQIWREHSRWSLQ